MTPILPWPTKTSPKPAVRGPDPVESALLRVEGYIASAPVSAEYLGMLNMIAGDLNAILLAVDPAAPRQAERLAIINAAVAQGAAGLPALLAYIDCDPSHPNDTTELAEWEAVQLGYEPPTESA